MDKETFKLLNACLPEVDDTEAFYASVEKQIEGDLQNLTESDPIECIYDCRSCPDFNCVCNLAN